jgi:hypothetical protein
MLTVFKSKTKRRHALTYEISEDSIHFTLKESDNSLTVSEWESTGHQGGLALLQHFQDTDAFVDMTANTLSFTHETFMQWCEGQERYIQMPVRFTPLI